MALPGDCRCAEHAASARAALRAAPQRKERAALYKTKTWAAIRRSVLDAQPLCVLCLKAGRYEPSVVVDHIVPHKGDTRLFYDMSNLQGLCKACHDRKTASEDGGFGRG